MNLSTTAEETREPSALEADSTNYESNAGAEDTYAEAQYDENGQPIEAQVELDTDGNPVEAQIQPGEETQPQDTTPTATAPTYWGPGAFAAPAVTDEDEQQFVSRAEMKRYAAEVAREAARVALQGYEASSAVTGFYLRTAEEKAPEFMREYGPGVRQALASVDDPQEKAKKETTNSAILTAVLRDANAKGIDAVDAILHAATLIQRGRAQPPTAPRQPNPARQVPSPGGGRGAATVASNRPTRPVNNNSLMEELYGFSSETARDILRADEANKNKSRY